MATRARDTALLLLTCGLLIAVAVQHARTLARLGGFGLSATEVVLFAVLVVLLAGAAALLHQAQRQGLSTRTVRALVPAIVVLLLVVIAGRDADEISAYGAGGLGLGGAYSSTLLLDFSPELPWATAVVVVAALGLLPVAGAAAWSRRDGRLRLDRRSRAALLAVCAAAVVVLLVHLELSVALLDVVAGEAQQLTALDALTWVAALWSLVAVLGSVASLRGPDVARLAVLAPAVVLLAWGLLLLGDAERHTCCFAYAPLDGSAFEYVPPPLLPDLLLLGGCLLVGVALPVVLHSRRSSTSASTPPG